MPAGVDGQRRHPGRWLRPTPRCFCAWSGVGQRHRGGAPNSGHFPTQPDVDGAGGPARWPHRKHAAHGHQHAVLLCRFKPGCRRSRPNKSGGELRPLSQRHCQALCRCRFTVHCMAGRAGLQVCVHAPLPHGAGACGGWRDQACHLGDARTGHSPGVGRLLPVGL